MLIRWDYIHDLENQNKGRPSIREVVYNGEIIDELASYKNGRANQRMIIFKYKNYLYVAPYVYDDKF